MLNKREKAQIKLARHNLNINVFLHRVCGKMEPGDARVGDAVSSLSSLLRHSDARVADAALRCFASLADRFARAHADPAPLAEHGKLMFCSWLCSSD